MHDLVRITDVAPRDGLQAEEGAVGLSTKVALVRACAGAGADEVEVSSFVSPKWVPQLGDAAEVFDAVAELISGGDLARGEAGPPLLSALVPNERGLEGLFAANAAARERHGVEMLIGKASVFTAASQEFSRRNTNASIEETIERFEPVIARAKGAGLRTRGYISCVVACPFEGAVDPEAVGDVASELLRLGVDEIDLGDTIGEGTADSIGAVLLEVVHRLDGRALNDSGEPMVTLHLHDTFGRAASCVEAGLELGVRSFDASTGGLGGCPYAATATARAPGNLAMRTLIETIEAAGLSHGVDRAALGVAEAVAARALAEASEGAG